VKVSWQDVKYPNSGDWIWVLLSTCWWCLSHWPCGTGLYLIADSELHVAILALFCQLQCRYELQPIGLKTIFVVI